MKLEFINYEAHAGLGVTFPAKCFIIEETDQFSIISPCSLDEDTKAKLKNSHKKLNFIAPNNMHNLYLSEMKNNFPKAQFFGPKRSAIQSKVDLQNTKEFSSKDIQSFFIEGNNALCETCFYHSPSKTLIVTDLFFNMHHQMNFSTKTAMKFAGTYKKLGTSRAIHFTMKDKTAFINSITNLSQLDIEKVIPSHGDEINKEQFLSWVESFKGA